MHANVQTRFNPATGNKAPYYRLKESYRDVAGHVHSLILLNIGFEPSLTAVQVRKNALALTERFKNRDVKSLFNKPLDGLSEIEQAKADEWWQQMIEEGGIDRFNKKEQKSRKESVLGGQHHPLWIKVRRRILFLDRNRATNEYSEVSHDGGQESLGRYRTDVAMK